MLQKIPFAILFLCAMCPPASAQVLGGRNTFSFMGLSPSSRATALGGIQIAVKDDELAFAALNPAVLNPSMSGRLAFNHNFYLADIQHGYASYGHYLPKTGFTLHGGIQYTDYGNIKQANEMGTVTGEVKAKETMLVAGGARPLSSRLSLGLNVKFAMSTLDLFQASAIATDAGLLYADTSKRYSMAVVLKNAGAMLKTYAGEREALPFDLQASFCKRLKHLPFRFGVVVHHLHQWDIRFNDPAIRQSTNTNLSGEQEPENRGLNEVDNFFRHFIFNGEFLFGKKESFRIRFGYNHLRKRELSVLSYRSLAGFSGGLGVKINSFRLDFGYSSYHLAGGTVHLGLGTNLQDFL